MLYCPNKNLKAFKDLVKAVGEPTAYLLWNEYEGDVPSKFYKSNIENNRKESTVDFIFKATEFLMSKKGKEIWSKGEKNNWDINKTLTEIGIPKEQKLILTDIYNNLIFVGKDDTGKDIVIKPTLEEVLSNFTANYSYTVEINTAKTPKVGEKFLDREYGYELEVTEETLQNQINDGFVDNNLNTQYYSNLTVPGGTNYTENEIATPAITPNIKGHAQFATEKGIGWFRSDEQRGEPLQKRPNEFDGGDSLWKKENKIWYQKVKGYEEWNKRDDLSDDEVYGIYDGKYGVKDYKIDTLPTKTRRILEVQSDLFQKGRSNVELIPTYQKARDTKEWMEIEIEAHNALINNEITEEEYKKRLKTFEDNYENNISKNNFLQLLNKDNNWVTFFVKSIIQDSAKKGYEKVLFPSGNTASKVEGHSTLEEFKKQKEDRIKELENTIKKTNNKEFIDRSRENLFYSDNVTDEQIKEELVTDYNREITQLKQELERVETEGFGALKPIYNFYENTVSNILKKQGFNPVVVTDEYGNTWYEIDINEIQSKGNLKVQLAIEDSKAVAYYDNNGKVVFKKGASLTPEIVIHEFAHPFVDALVRDNHPLFKKLVKDIAATEPGKEIVQYVQDNYGDKDSLTKNKEVLVRAIAMAGKKYIDPNTGKGLLAAVQKFLKFVNDLVNKTLQSKIKNKETLNVTDFDLSTKVIDIAKILTLYEGKIDLSPRPEVNVSELGAELTGEGLDAINALFAEASEKIIEEQHIPIQELETAQEDLQKINNLKEIASSLDNTEVDDGFKLFTPSTVDNKIQSSELEIVSKLIPKEIRLSIISDFIETASKGNKAVGQFKNGMIYIYKNAPKGTAFHEAFHAIFRTVLSEKEHQDILNEAKTLFVKPTPEELEKLQEVTKIEDIAVLTDLYYEEKLADAFSDYMENYISNDVSYPSKIKAFFNKIKNWLTNIFSNKKSVDKLFSDIAIGKYANASVKNTVVRGDSYKLFKHPHFTHEEINTITKQLVFIGFSKVTSLKNLDQIDLSLIHKSILAKVAQNIDNDLLVENLSRLLNSDNSGLDSFWQQSIENFLEKEIGLKKVNNNKRKTNKILNEPNSDNSDIEELDANGFVKSSWEVSGTETATKAAKFLMYLVPKIEGIDPVTGKYIYKISKVTGYPEFLDFGSVWTSLESSASNIVPTLNKETGLFEDNLKLIQAKLRNDGRIKPFLNFVADKIDAMDTYAKGQIVFTLSKQLGNYTDYLIRGNVSTNENGNSNSSIQFLILDSLIETKQKYIVSNWVDSFIEKVEVYNDNSKIYNKQEIAKLVKLRNKVMLLGNKVLSENNLQQEDIIKIKDTFEYLGLNMPLEAINVLIENNAGIEKDLTIGFFNVTKKIFNALSEVNTIYSSTTDVVINPYANIIKSEKFFNEEIPNILALFSSMPGESMFLGPDGNKIWLGQNNSMVSKIVNQLKNGDLSPIEKLKNSPFHKNSKFIELINNEETREEFLKSFEIRLSGNNRLDSSEDSGSKLSDLKYADQLMSSINSTLKGVLVGLAEADKTQQNFIQIDKKFLLNAKLLTEGNKIELDVKSEAFNYLLDTFISELYRMRTAHKEFFGYTDEKGVEHPPLSKEKQLKFYHHYTIKGKEGKETVPGGAFYSFIFPSLDLAEAGLRSNVNEIIKPFTRAELQNNEYIVNHIKKAFKKQLKANVKEAVAYGIIATNAKLSTFENRLVDSKILEDNGNNIEQVFANYTINSILGNIEQIKLFNQDPALYKVKPVVKEGIVDWKSSNHFGDFMKRIPAAFASGKDFWLKEGANQVYMSAVVSNVEGQPSSYFAKFDENGKVILDPEAVAEIANTTNTPEDQVISLLEAYTDVNKTDAQAWISIDAYKERMEGFSKWTPEHEAAYIKIKNNQVLDFKEIALMAQPLKTVHVEVVILNGYLPSLQYNKQSEAVLLPQVAKALQIGKLLEAMERDNIDHVITLDGKKVGTTEDTLIFNTEGNILEKGEIKFNAVPLNYNNLFLQQDLTPHGIGQNLVGSQTVKVTLSTLVKDEKYIDNTKTGEDILNYYHSVISKLSDKGLIELNEKLGINPNETFNDNSTFRKFLASELGDSFPDVVIEAIRDGIEIESLPVARQIKNKFNSLYTKSTVKLKQLGGAMIQLSDFGFVGLEVDINNKAVKDGIIFLKPQEELLKPMRVEEGVVKPAQVLLPYTALLELLEKKFPGKSYKDLNPQEIKDSIDVSALLGLSYRIPNQGPSSNDVFEIAGFLPPEMGDTIISYSAITKKTGSDFDIDKAFIILPNIFYNNETQKVEAVKFDLETIDTQNKKQLQNARLFLMQQMLLHPAAYLNVMSPLDDPTLEDYVKNLFPEDSQFGSLDFVNGITQLTNKNTFDTAKALVGIIANHMSHQGLAKHAELYFDDYYLGVGQIAKKEENITEDIDFEDVTEENFENKKLEFNTEQKIAIEKTIDFIKNGNPDEFFVIEGKAGTGKTTIVKEIIDNLDTKSIVIAALSHKAKSVLNEKLNGEISSYSIAGLLGMTLDMETGIFKNSKENVFAEYPIENYKVIIIDEASMVNEEALDLIMEMKDPNAKVIFIGDIGQLPPIRTNKNPYYEGKNDLFGKKSPVFNSKNKTTLVERVRQGELSPILPFADYYWENSQKNTPLQNPVVEERKSIISESGNLIFVNSFENISKKVVNLFLEAKKDFNPNYIKFVTYRNSKKEEINNFIHSALFGKNSNEFNEGELIIFNDNFKSFENSYETSVIEASEEETDSNNLNYFLLTVEDAEFNKVKIPVLSRKSKNLHNELVKKAFSEAFASKGSYNYKENLAKAWGLKNKFANIDYGYAITSHKSQGSTYDYVIVDAQDINSVSLISNKEKSESIYTALTRARNTAIVISETQVKEENVNIPYFKTKVNKLKLENKTLNKEVIEEEPNITQTSLSNDFSTDGFPVEKALGMFMNAIVDAAKDPYIARANINMQTAGVAFMLIRAGVPMKWVVSFISQPIIKEYINESNKLEGRFPNAQKGEKALTNIAKKYIVEKPKANENENLFYSKQLGQKGTLKNNSNSGQITVSESRLNSQEFKLDVDNQLKVLNQFREWQAKAKEFNEVIDLTKVDVLGAGSEITDTKLMYKQALRILSKKAVGNLENLTGMYVEDNKITYSQTKRMTGAFFKNSVEELLKVSSNLFLDNTISVNTTVDNLLASIGYFELSNNYDDKNLLSKIEQFIISKLKSNSALKLTRVQFKDILLGNSNTVASKEAKLPLIERVIEAKKRYENSNLFVKLLETHKPFGNKRPFITIPNTTLVKSSKEQLMDDFEKLYTEDKDLAIDLVKIAFYSSGFNKGIGSFYDLIPPKIITDLGIDNDIQSLKGLLNNPMSLDSSVVDNLFKHLYEDNKIVPNINISKTIPILNSTTKKELPKSIAFGVSPSTGNNYIAGVDKKGNLVYKPFIKVSYLTTYSGIPVEQADSSDIYTKYNLYKFSGYTKTGGGVYLRTNTLGYYNKGQRYFEFFEDNNTSIFKENIVPLDLINQLSGLKTIENIIVPFRKVTVEELTSFIESEEVTQLDIEEGLLAYNLCFK